MIYKAVNTNDNLSLRLENKLKMNSSSIFKDVPTDANCSFHHTKEQTDYKKSDIFFKNAAEKLPLVVPKYNTGTLSNSQWNPKATKPNLYNYESRPYDLINLNGKNKNYFGTVKQNPEFTQNKRQKAICEYLDLTKVSYFNTNKEYLKAFKENPLLFRRQKGVCSELYSVYKDYNNLINKPFKQN